MKNLSTGTGLCIAGLCAVAFPFAQKLASFESQAHAGGQASAMTAVASSATAQATPTIVWYGIAHNQGALTYNNFFHQPYSIIARAWSDGRVEVKKVCSGSTCGDQIADGSGWVTVSAANQGFNAASDINFDSRVDGADLGQLLTDWGDAPRQDIPPSDCPLNLVNP